MQHQTPAAGIIGSLPAGVLTGAIVNSSSRYNTTKFSWVNADIVGLGAVTSGNLLVTTLPARTLVKGARIVITGTAAGTTTLTCSLGVTASAYIDYIVVKTAQVTPNTIYGSAFTDLGSNLSALVGNLASLTSTTAVNIQFISTISNLSSVTGSTGDIFLETITLP